MRRKRWVLVLLSVMIGAMLVMIGAVAFADTTTTPGAVDAQQQMQNTDEMVAIELLLHNGLMGVPQTKFALFMGPVGLFMQPVAIFKFGPNTTALMKMQPQQVVAMFLGRHSSGFQAFIHRAGVNGPGIFFGGPATAVA